MQTYIVGRAGRPHSSSGADASRIASRPPFQSEFGDPKAYPVGRRKGASNQYPCAAANGGGMLRLQSARLVVVVVEVRSLDPMWGGEIQEAESL